MNLSIAELRKRNNFTIFRNRIRDNQNFTLNESNGRTIRITNSVYREIGSIDEMIEKYAQGRSIFLPVGANANQEINLTSLYKDSAFAGRTQNTTAAEDAEVATIRNRLQQIKDQLGTEVVSLRVGNTDYQVVDVESTPGVPKSDFHFINSSGQMVGFVSHKDGTSARSIQQWGGMSEREPVIFSHPETQQFIADLQERYPSGIFPNATTLARRITDPNLRLKSVYGGDYSQGGQKGINNVDLLLQGRVSIIARGTSSFTLQASSHTHSNGTQMTGTYEPVFMVIYKGDRNQAGLRGARTVISSSGGRGVTEWI